MKKLLSVLFLSIIAFAFTNCSSDDDSTIVVTGISLSADSLEVAMEASSILTATLLPDGASGDIAWSSSAPSVAAVSNGVVTGISMGEATIAATCGVYSATCVVTVTAKEVSTDDYPSLQGSDYYVIQLDGNTYSVIEDKVAADLRVDDATKFLYIWDNTFSAGTSSGLNFFGQSESWVSLVVGSVGWSGAGFFLSADYGTVDMTDLYANPNDYVLHIGMKSTQESTNYLFILTDGTSTANVCIGPSAYTDNGVSYQPYADFTRDGEWHEIEIPISYLNGLGLYYNNAFSAQNIFAFLAGGTSGTTLEMDGIFFYKPASK